MSGGDEKTQDEGFGRQYEKTKRRSNSNFYGDFKSKDDFYSHYSGGQQQKERDY